MSLRGAKRRSNLPTFLLKRTRQDLAWANRLIEHERKLAPDASFYELCRRAIQKIE